MSSPAAPSDLLPPQRYAVLSCTSLLQKLRLHTSISTELGLPSTLVWTIRTTDGELHVVFDTRMQLATQPDDPLLPEDLLRELRDCVAPNGKIRSDSKIGILFQRVFGASVRVSYTDCISIFPPPDYSYLKEKCSAQTEEIIKAECRHVAEQQQQQRLQKHLENEVEQLRCQYQVREKQHIVFEQGDREWSTRMTKEACNAKLALARTKEQADSERILLAQQRDAAYATIAEQNLIIEELRRQLEAKK